MKAALIAQAKEVRDDGSIVEIVVWELNEPLPPCRHPYKYRLFFGRADECFVRYDNERGKGDIGTRATLSRFTTSPRWTRSWPISSAT